MEYTKVGFIGKSHGLKGELKFKIEDDFLEDFSEIDVIFVEIRGKKTPYFIENIRAPNNPIIKFEDIESKEAATIIQHKAIFMKTVDVQVPEIESDLVYAKYIDYLITDKSLGKLGKIETVEDFPQQEMAIITIKNNDVLIPMNDLFISKIDDKSKTIEMDLPEGLVSL
jgi:16S rRNA processing protein RimM